MPATPEWKMFTPQATEDDRAEVAAGNVQFAYSDARASDSRAWRWRTATNLSKRTALYVP